MPETINRPRTDDVSPLVKHIYERHCSGCCLHIVLEDRNVRDSDVEFCLAEAVKAVHYDCEALARLMLRMSKTQRRKLSRVPDRV